MTAAPLHVTPAGAEHAALLAGLFARADVACHCRYWHFNGDTNAWLDRCAHSPGQNQQEMNAALGANSDEMSGLVLLREGTALGWLKLTRATSVSKLYEQRLYRRLPCFEGPREGVFTVGCLLVDPAVRGQGIAQALLGGAVALARERGARAIEAFPRRTDQTRAEEVWTGPFSMYIHAGFRVVHDFAPYPVLRLSL